MTHAAVRARTLVQSVKTKFTKSPMTGSSTPRRSTNPAVGSIAREIHRRDGVCKALSAKRLGRSFPPSFLSSFVRSRGHPLPINVCRDKGGVEIRKLEKSSKVKCAKRTPRYPMNRPENPPKSSREYKGTLFLSSSLFFSGAARNYRRKRFPGCAKVSDTRDRRLSGTPFFRLRKPVAAFP